MIRPKPTYTDFGCTCFKLRKAVRRTTKLYERHLRPSGLRLPQFGLLGMIGAQRKGLSITSLSEIMAIDRTTLTRNLRPLETQGLVSVVDGPDQRTKAVELTAKGKEVLMAAAPLWRAAQKELRETLGSEFVADLNNTLDKTFLGLAQQHAPRL